MDEEQRNQTRDPSFDVVELVTTDESGEENAYPIMLRDKSNAGLGGVYIGQEPLNTDSVFLLRGSGVELKKLRIAWTKNVAEYVQILGFEAVED